MISIIRNLGKQANNDSFESLFEKHGEKYRWLAIAAVGSGTFVALLMTTIINVALPEIMGAFGIDQSEAQWLSTGFLASSTISMLISGWLVNRFGVQSAFFFPSLLFIGASFMASISPNNDMLIVARVFQGFAYGFYMPIAMYVMSRIFPPEKQGVGMGIFGILAILGPAIGPYVGGLAVDAYGWRSVFYLPLPLALISLPLCLWYLPGATDPKDKTRLDMKSVAWLSIAITLILVGLSNGQKLGWDSSFVIGSLLVGGFAAFAFISQQLVSDSPLLNLTLFQYKSFTYAALISVLFGAGLFGGMYASPLFLQIIQGVSATEAGLAMLPAGLLLTIAFPVVGYFSDKVPQYLLVMAGMAVLAYGTALMVFADQFTPFWTICWWLVLSRIGMAIVMPPLSMASMSSLPPQLLTQASGSINFIRQLGGAMGVNLTSVILTRRTSKHMDYINSLQNEENVQTQTMLSQLVPELHQSGVDTSLQEPLAAWIMQKELYTQAMTLSFQDTFFIMGMVLAVGIIPAYMLRHTQKHPKE